MTAPHTHELPPLLASCWTTAGDVGPTSAVQRGRFPLPDRIAAAAAAGFRGFGFVHADLVAERETHGYARLQHLLGKYGMQYVEVEMLNDWYAEGPRRTESDLRRRDLLEAAAALGALHIKIGGEIAGRQVDRRQFIREFALLCEQAAEHGTRIAFEPMPFGNIDTVDSAVRLIDECGHPAGGLILDLWHVARSATPFDALAHLDKRYVFAVELDDADQAVAGSMWDDTLSRRRLCGDGDQDVVGFIRAVRATGFEGPWGVEILSDQFRTLPLADQANSAHRSSHAALTAAFAPETPTDGRPRVTDQRPRPWRLPV